MPVSNKTVNVIVPIVDSTISSSSANPVQNSAIYNALSDKVDTSSLDNYYQISEVDNLLNAKASTSSLDNYYPKNQTYSKSESDALLNNKANSSVVDTITSQITSLASGSPLVASSTSEMEDTTRVYVNTTDGHWYFYDGSAWADGGVYQASENSTLVEAIVEYITREENPHYKGYVRNNGTLNPQTSASATNRYTIFDDVIPNSSFIYSGAYSGWAVVWGYYQDDTAIPLLGAGTYDNKIIKITDTNIKKVIAWSDTAVKELSFKYYNEDVQLPRTIVVDSEGDGDFTDIQSAIDFATLNYDVVNIPITIFVKNGVYNVSPKATTPFYAINKGTNKISIIGESKDHTIINCTCTDELQGTVLNIGGECVIENLTINNFADASYTSQTILEGNHRPYCIHNDAIIVNNTNNYYTTVRNCKLYSECYTPLGAGLHHLQTQKYENVEFIYNSNVYNTEGAIYIHTSYDNTAIPSGLEIIDCTAISKNFAPAIYTINIANSLNFGSIPQTYKRNITDSNGTTEISLISRKSITSASKLNSNSLLDAD